MKQPHSSSNGTSYGYRVEVRDDIFNGHHPIMLPDGMVTDKWREISTRYTPMDGPFCGITLEGHRCPEAALSDLLPIETARALAYWLISLHPLSQLQCRLMSYKLEWTTTLHQFGELEASIISTDVLTSRVPVVKPEATPHRP